ncbi:polyribonucleotide nucleotidyltransferase [Candidatus Dependentiae bacterium]
MSKIFKLDEFGYSVDIGKVAGQADGAAWFRQGDTLLLATVVSNPSKEFLGFLPLTTDYREPFSAAGKIPGGYFKREGKSTDREVLISRLIDRAIRPLFPETYFSNLQVLVTVYSVDKKHTPGKLALLAASIALTVSKIPFFGPVGVVEVGKVDGQWIFDPSYELTLESDARIVFAGTQEGICMVEGSTNQISESDFLDIMFKSHERIKKQVEWQKKIKKELSVVEEIPDDGIDWDGWKAKVDKFLTKEYVESMYVADKVERKDNLKKLKEDFNNKYKDEIEETETHQSVINYILDLVLKKKLTDCVIDKNVRVDGRAFDQVRKITTEVGLLPTTHGSALFNRGKTQALVSVTLGGGQDEQKIEGILDEPKGSAFMLHYNFPPFSVGEARFLRGPGRREIGHGYLAKSSFKYLLPSKEDFPYTIRIIADMLESDGSTSMATTCGSTMALMDTGVPLKKMVGGVATGLLRRSSDGAWAVLTDISGFEDAFGLMDFKVTGTDEGITAIQMDIKHKAGFPREVFESALEQAKNGRIYILDQMKKVMSKPKAELSDLVPKVISITVPTDKIGAIIGTGGKIIREIIDVTKTNIDIDGEGKVRIYGGPDADIEKALAWVKVLGGQIEDGSRYVGIVRRIADFGLFVELVPGADGLVHVSNIPRDKQKDFMRQYKVDQKVEVEVISYDPTTGRIRLKIIEENNS